MDNLKELYSEHPYSAINVLLYLPHHLSIYLSIYQFSMHFKLRDISTYMPKYVSIYVINYSSIFVYSTFIETKFIHNEMYTS